MLSPLNHARFLKRHLTDDSVPGASFCEVDFTLFRPNYEAGKKTANVLLFFDQAAHPKPPESQFFLDP
jgi:hypothetical protein